MKSYLLVWFSSDGGNPSEVTRTLVSLGFKPLTGNYDYVYDWGEASVSVDDVLSLADKVKSSLQGMGVLFKIETVDMNYETY